MYKQISILQAIARTDTPAQAREKNPCALIHCSNGQKALQIAVREPSKVQHVRAHLMPYFGGNLSEIPSEAMLWYVKSVPCFVSIARPMPANSARLSEQSMSSQLVVNPCFVDLCALIGWRMCDISANDARLIANETSRQYAVMLTKRERSACVVNASVVRLACGSLAVHLRVTCRNLMPCFHHNSAATITKSSFAKLSTIND